MKTARILYALATTALLVLATGGASAGATYSGFLAAGQPTTYFGVGGITENVAPCDTSSTFNGLDGHWYDVAGEGDSAITLQMDVTLDADAHWFDAECNYLGSAADMWFGETESGTLHANAAYIIVSGFAGSGYYTLTIA